MRRIFTILYIGLSVLSLHADEKMSKIAVLYFYESDCPNCAMINRDVMPLIREQYGDRITIIKRNVEELQNFEAMMAFETFYKIPPKNVPEFYTSYGVAWNRDMIVTDLPALIEKELEDPSGGKYRKFLKKYLKSGQTGISVAESIKSQYGEKDSEVSDVEQRALVEGRSSTQTAEDVSINHKLLIYEFRKPGCRSCNRVSQDLRYLKQKYKDKVVIKSFNIKDNTSKVLNEALCIKYNIPEEKHLATPALFFGKQAIIGESAFDRKNILLLLIGAVGSDERFVTMEPSDSELAIAHDAIYSRFAAISWGAVLTAGFLDGVNPCAFVTIVFLLSYLGLMKYSRRDIALVGASFTLAVFFTYLLIGLGFLKFVSFLQDIPYLDDMISSSAIFFASLVGILNIRDYWKVKRGSMKDMDMKLSSGLRSRINAVIRKNVKLRHYVVGAFGMGCAISLLELACTGQVYLPTVLFIINTQGIEFRALILLVAYNLAFIIPLIVIFILFWTGSSEKHISKWLSENGARIKLAMGLLFIFLAVALYFF